MSGRLWHTLVKASDEARPERLVLFLHGILGSAENFRRFAKRFVTEHPAWGALLVDLPETVMLAGGDRLMLDDGRQVGVQAAPEELYDIRARDPVHLAELAWHIGNRHLAAAIEADRILILRDHVIKAMLEGLGASVTDTTEAFNPVRGAYSGHATHGHDHGHHGHGHGHGEPDQFGRRPRAEG